MSGYAAANPTYGTYSPDKNLMLGSNVRPDNDKNRQPTAEKAKS
jgi:hypothetical protein